MGVELLERYFAQGLARLPDLWFDLLAVLTGVGSLVIVYRNQRGWAVAEQMTRDAGLVVAVSAHYSAGAWESVL